MVGDKFIRFELAALLLAPRLEACIALGQVSLDGWEVVVVSGLPTRMTARALARVGLHTHVDRIVPGYVKCDITQPEHVNYSLLKEKTRGERRLTLPIRLAYDV